MLGKKFLKSVAKKAINVGEEISQEAYDAAKFVGRNTVKVGEKLEEAASQAVGAVTDNLSGNVGYSQTPRGTTSRILWGIVCDRRRRWTF